MTTRTATRLARTEWEFAQVDAALADLGKTLHECADEAPDCVGATLELKGLRKRLLAVWRKVEHEINDAQAVVETLEAPF